MYGFKEPRLLFPEQDRRILIVKKSSSELYCIFANILRQALLKLLVKAKFRLIELHTEVEQGALGKN